MINGALGAKFFFLLLLSLFLRFPLHVNIFALSHPSFPRPFLRPQDGRLHKNDQVLSVNGHNLLGHSNHEAMDILKQAMADHYTVQLVVARRVGQTTPSMAALGEEPEEVGVT